MGVSELLASPWGMASICAIVLVAGFAHGLSGFGFPVISTPMAALYTDVRTAVLVTLIPNIVINVISATSGSEWRANLRRHFWMPVYVLLGTLAGTQVVLRAPANALRIFLAAVIVLYLCQHRLRSVDWTILARHPQASGLAVGLLGGFLSGTVNVMLPPLLIYFTTLGLAPVMMTQVLNACFLVGKVSQAAVFAAHGQFVATGLLLTLPVCAVALAGYVAGRRLQPRISMQAYRRIIRGVLWAMAALLLLQAGGFLGKR